MSRWWGRIYMQSSHSEMSIISFVTGYITERRQPPLPLHPHVAWRQHDMDTLSALLVPCAGNPPVPVSALLELRFVTKAGIVPFYVPCYCSSKRIIKPSQLQKPCRTVKWKNIGICGAPTRKPWIIRYQTCVIMGIAWWNSIGSICSYEVKGDNMLKTAQGTLVGVCLYGLGISVAVCDIFVRQTPGHLGCQSRHYLKPFSCLFYLDTG